jgi:hypothetical protein
MKLEIFGNLLNLKNFHISRIDGPSGSTRP